MTQTIAVNADNDMYLDSTGNIALVYGLQATLQSCAQVAKTILGEMVLATNQGIPYFEVVFNGIPNLTQYSAALQLAWAAVPDVIEIISLTIGQSGNQLTYTAVINTDYGVGEISG